MNQNTQCGLAGLFLGFIFACVTLALIEKILPHEAQDPLQELTNNIRHDINTLNQNTNATEQHKHKWPKETLEIESRLYKELIKVYTIQFGQALENNRECKYDHRHSSR